MTQPARVVFTQFLQPNGRKAPCPIAVSEEAKTGQLNMDCSGAFHGDDQPIASHLCAKIDVEAGAETLIRTAYKRYIARVD